MKCRDGLLLRWDYAIFTSLAGRTRSTKSMAWHNTAQHTTYLAEAAKSIRFPLHRPDTLDTLIPLILDHLPTLPNLESFVCRFIRSDTDILTTPIPLDLPTTPAPRINSSPPPHDTFRRSNSYTQGIARSPRSGHETHRHQSLQHSLISPAISWPRSLSSLSLQIPA